MGSVPCYPPITQRTSTAIGAYAYLRCRHLKRIQVPVTHDTVTPLSSSKKGSNRRAACHSTEIAAVIGLEQPAIQR